MEISLEQYENIQRYLENSMDDVERSAFLKELESNNTLKESFDLEKTLRDYLPIKQKVLAAGKEWKPVHKLQVSFKLSLAIAASIILVIISTVLFIILIPSKESKRSTASTNPVYKNPNDSLLIIAKQNREQSLPPMKPKKSDNIIAKKNKDSIIKISGENVFKKEYAFAPAPDNIPENIKPYTNDYNEHHFDRIQELDVENSAVPKGYDEYPLVEIIRLYRGISFIETKDYDKALNDFHWLINNGTNKSLKQKSHWYAALLYIRKNDFAKAIPLLAQLANDANAVYHEKAGELLQRLK